MAGKRLTHDRIKWVSGVVRKLSDRNYAIDLACARCGEHQRRVYCCYDRAKELGLECYARLHCACAEKPKKETVV